MKKNIFLTFCFSFIPGAGQMYQSYMKRGISLMTMFAVIIGVMAVVPIPLFAIPIPVIYAFSFFDTYNIRNKIGTDKEEKDEYLWNSTSFMDVLQKVNFKKKNSFIGVLLILIGIYILLNTVIYNLAMRFDIYVIELFVDSITRYLVPILISAISIGIGIKFISKK